VLNQAPPPIPAKPECAPPEKPLHFLDFPPPDFYFLRKRLFLSGALSLCDIAAIKIF
jgi:hypothetical protein